MPKKYRPVTPGSRFLTLESMEELTRVAQINESETSRARVKPKKSLLRPKKRTGGRNNLGRVTCRHRGRGHKRKTRIIDFRRDKDGVPAAVASIEYDPNRSGRLALLKYADGEQRYILAPQDLKPGDQVMSGPEAPYRIGCSMPMRLMPIGSVVHNVEMRPGGGGKLVRSAGLSAQLAARSGGQVTLRMPSGETRMIHEDCRATFGVVSNPEHNLRWEGKAGRRRWLGIRPTVRGTAMNPVDHPHGGGEGKHNGYISQSPWAWPTKGYKTRNKRKSLRFIVKDRRK